MVEMNPHSFSAVVTPPYSENVHLWLLDFDELASRDSSKYLHILSDNEQHICTSLQQRQNEYIFTRAFLRLCLSQYTSIDPTELTFAREASGKPYLTNHTAPLFFNLSHTQSHVAIAICAHTNIGVDIEIPRRRNFMAIAERYFSDVEILQLKACKDQDQQTLFLKLWTLKEAFFKATGSGISAGLHKAEFDLTKEKIEFMLDDDLLEQESHWQFFQNTLSNNLYLSIASKQKKPIEPAWFHGKSLFI